ncbi:serine hydrolase [Paenibacillus sp. JTLBN-2024]
MIPRSSLVKPDCIRLIVEWPSNWLVARTCLQNQRPAAETPDKWTSGNIGWGLGWMLYDWNGVSVFGHDGATIGQNSYLRVVPGCGVAVALLANGGNTDLLQSALFRELFKELAGASMPDAVFEPAPYPPAVDIKPFVGTYKRQGVVMTVTERNGMLHLLYEIFDGRQIPSPPLEITLSPVSETVFAGGGHRPGLDTRGFLNAGGRFRILLHRHASRTENRVSAKFSL